MSDITGYVRAAYQGMSQAPVQDRIREACRLMENVFPAIPSGAQKRPPLEWLGRVIPPGQGTSTPIFHPIPQGSLAEDLSLVLSDEGVNTVARLFKDIDQSPVPITGGITAAAQAYINYGNPVPIQDLRVFPIEDVVFITNRLRPVAASGDVSPTRPHEAVIWVKTGQYSRHTRVTVNYSGGSISADYSPSTGGSANDAKGVGTDVIASGLYNGTIVAGSGAVFTGQPLSDLGSHGFTVTLVGSLIYLTHPTDNFTIALSDDQGGQGVVAIKDAVQRFSDLPAVAKDGFTVRVAQEITGGNSDYYVKFVAGNSTNTGVWKEVIAPGTPLGLDPETMPIILHKVAGAWTLEHPDWGQRTTGTELLSPDPQFVGEHVKTLRWFGGRLLLISDSSAILSGSDDPYKFYSTTLASSLASDPIERANPIDGKVFFEDCEVFTDVGDSARALVFGDKGQAVLRVQGPIVVDENVSFEQFGRANYSPLIPLAASASHLYFGSFRPNSAAIYELAPDRLSGQTVPEEMSLQIPRLLPRALDRVASLSDEYLTLRGTSGATSMWLHLYRRQKGDLIQNSWSRWNLPPGFTLSGMYMAGSILNLLLLDSESALHWCRMEIVPANVDVGGSILQHLDVRLADIDLATPGAYDPATGLTTYALPFPVTDDVVASVRGIQDPTADYPEGFLPPIYDVDVDDAQMVLSGDWSGVPLWFGYTYRSTIVPSTLFKYGQDGAPEQNGKLTIKRLIVDLARTGYLRFETYLRGKGRTEPYVMTYEGYRQDDVTTPIDSPPGDGEDTVKLEVPIGSNNLAFETFIINDSHLGFLMVGFEYLAQWRPLGRRAT